MQKIMFEHRRFGLEQAVLAGTKIMTHRRIHFPGIDDEDVLKPVMGTDEKGRAYFTFDARTEDVDVYPKYQIGEKVVVAQSYETILSEHGLPRQQDPIDSEYYDGLHDAYRNPHVIRAMMNCKAYTNKLFVRADLMPHVIEITDIKAERLQDISDEDCLKEGVTKWLNCYIVTGIMEHHGQNNVCFDTPREAFAVLINRLSGCDTWERNEWQFAYTFKLIK